MRYSIIFFLLFSSWPQAASFEVGKKAFLSTYDGDTVKVKFRLAGIDTPEIKGHCDFEKSLALKARDFTRAFITRSKKITFVTNGVGRYGRPLVDIRSEHGFLNELLVSNGLARVYRGRRESWCN
jgi:endonuclease YncB( thermonuclease family)